MYLADVIMHTVSPILRLINYWRGAGSFRECLDASRGGNRKGLGEDWGRGGKKRRRRRRRRIKKEKEEASVEVDSGNNGVDIFERRQNTGSEVSVNVPIKVGRNERKFQIFSVLKLIVNETTFIGHE